MNDDLDEEIIDSEDGFDEFSGKSDSSSGDFKKSPVVKIGVVVGVVAALAGVMMFMDGEEVQEAPSSLPSTNTVTSVPATDDKVDPEYLKAVEEANEADLERAISTGDSAIPVPVETPETRLDVPQREEVEEDPLHKWRMMQAEQEIRNMNAQETESEPVTVLDNEQQSEAIKALSESMMKQMESVLSRSVEQKTFTTKTFIEYKENDAQAANAAVAGGGVPAGGAASSGFTEKEEEVVIIPAGKIVYGQMLLEANSDVESVVLAQMVSGPLKGWKLLGQFETFEDLEMLGVTFDTAVNDDGDQYDIDAIMLNPDTGLAAMSTDVDHRYLRRVILPSAAVFVEGFASALAEKDSTQVTISGDTVATETEEPEEDEQIATGVQEAGAKIAEFLDEEGDVPIRIMIEAGVPIGIFFAENVVESEGDI